MEQTYNRIPFSKWKLVEIMLAILFIVAPFYFHPNIAGGGLRIPNNISMWMVATIIISYSLHLVLNRPTFVTPRYFSYIVAFPVLITLSGFVTGVEQPLKWLFRLLFIWGGLAFFFSIFQHGLKQGRLDRILFFVVVSALLQGIVGVVQIFLINDMPFWLAKSDGVPSGMFQQINLQASFQVTAIMIGAYLISRPFIKFTKPWVKLILMLSVLCASLIVTASGSRIGALTLILGLLIIIPSQWQRFKKNKKLAMITLISLLTGIGVGSIVGNSIVIDKTVALQSGYSGDARLSIYAISLDLIKEKPLFGHGIGSFGRKFQYAKPNFYAAHPDAKLPNGYVDHPHNELILWLVEGGVTAGLGLICFLLGLVLAIRQQGITRGSAYLAMLLPLGLHTQVELPFYLSVLSWIIFLFLLSISFNTSTIKKGLKLSVFFNRFLYFCLMLFMAALLLFFLHSAKSNRDLSAIYFDLGKKQHDLSTALANPYFQNDTQKIYRAIRMYQGIEKQDFNEIWQMSQWGAKYVLHTPDKFVFEKTLKSYAETHMDKEFCETLEIALSIYPDDEVLNDAINVCP